MLMVHVLMLLTYAMVGMIAVTDQTNLIVHQQLAVMMNLTV